MLKTSRPHLIKRSLIVAVAMLLAVPVAAQDFSTQRLSDGVREIASDAYGGRWPGTEGERLTLEWLRTQYEAIGLEPGGENGSWYQEVTLQRITPAREATARWRGNGGQGGALRLSDGLALRALASGRYQGEGVPVVFAGYGIHAPERGWDDYGDVDVRGAVVIVMGGEPDFGTGFPTFYRNARHKEAEAVRRGAVGLITLVPVNASASNWQQGSRQASSTRTTVPGLNSVPLTGIVARDLFDRWASAAGLRGGDLVAAVSSGGFRAVPLEGVSLSADVEESIETLTTNNFVARIPGTDLADQTIVFSAHWDHVGERGGQIYNGAWDNATGTVGLVEMARELKAAGAPRRTIVFLHVTAEEQGLLGAFYYTLNPLYPLETTAANINIDMLPLSPPTRDLQIFGYGQNTLEDDLAVLAAEQGRVITDDGQPEQGFYTRSDHFAFAVRGVPALMPWHGVDWVEGGREAGLRAYDQMFRANYHQPSDIWTPDLDFRAAVQNLELLYRLALDLANSERWPQWKPGSEYAATRALSDDQRRQEPR
ncbi:MAG: M28 family peptidase [Brevundimonas sp.]|uniref:M28 family peptidase n=1 Tax=Brevundimonas sp. TaxID=1871086 RepID=UPI003918AD3B